MPTCKHCKKENIDKDDMHDENICDDCFMIFVEELEKSFEPYYSQNSKCFLCGSDLGRWKIKIIDNERKAVCFECPNKTPKIEIGKVYTQNVTGSIFKYKVLEHLGTFHNKNIYKVENIETGFKCTLNENDLEL